MSNISPTPSPIFRIILRLILIARRSHLLILPLTPTESQITFLPSTLDTKNIAARTLSTASQCTRKIPTDVLLEKYFTVKAFNVSAKPASPKFLDIDARNMETNVFGCTFLAVFPSSTSGYRSWNKMYLVFNLTISSYHKETPISITCTFS